jgi:hypothetical protein
VDRIILLSPSVHTNYDLRPALNATCEGIDSFYSKEDCYCLGLGMRVMALLGGTAFPAAGRVGFQPLACTPEDAGCLDKLRQYPWQQSMGCTGHDGGHYGCRQEGFLRTFVLPMMAGCRHDAGVCRAH